MPLMNGLPNTMPDIQYNLLFGRGQNEAVLEGRYANRHGLIAGATGTGKTVTVQVLAEGFSRMGVPVFMADVKGDLAGVARPGETKDFIAKRVKSIDLPYTNEGSPVVFWDLFGKQGHPIRTTVSEMGPLLLSRLLELNDTQEGVLNVLFAVADDEGLLLLDLKDLRSMLNFLGENARDISNQYGRVTSGSIGAIQRRLLVLEQAGAEMFFGEPALDLSDFMRTDLSGRGIISVLDASELIHKPKLYSTFLLWLLAELFEELPEVGDAARPRLVFFFDEAHLLFDDAPKALINQTEQVVRLIRSKGVGVYFCTQNPTDVPEDVLGQLGNRVQHALRAYTPKDRKTIRATAQNFVPNPDLDIEASLTQMGVGEALCSTLRGKGTPTMADACLIAPPRSRMGPISSDERATIRAASPVGTRYDDTIDRVSAFEKLASRAAQKVPEAPKTTSRSRSRQSVWEAALKSAARTMATSLSKKLVRGIFGNLGSKRRGR